MRESLVEKLRCPIDLEPLRLNVYRQDPDDHIVDGQLECMTCQRVYPIKKGVPDLVPEDSVHVGGDDLGRLQRATVKRFGFEWLYFRDWGWLNDYPDVPNAKEKFYGALIEHTHSAFWSKSLFKEKDLRPGLLILDAGCGNGRFTYQAAQTGAEVIGIDLGYGIYSAFDHTRFISNVHIVRGDLLRLPFGDKIFDRIFSIGVLQHTGKAEAAFDSLVRSLKPGSLIVAHVYGQGRRIYEVLDKTIRAFTVRLPIKIQITFARLTAVIARWLRGGNKRRTLLYRIVFSYINLLPTEHHMYDWWSAPIATHFTQTEVKDWFVKNHLEIIRSNPPLSDFSAEKARRDRHAAITILGRRSVPGWS